MLKPFVMKVAVIFVTLVAAIQGIPIGESPPGLSYYNQPAVVVRKVTYYEPELVAVVVEKGVDDIPAESYMIQNYADVLSSDNEIHVCSTDDASHCLDKPVTKLLVPSVFKSVGQNGFQDFFKHAQQVPWVSTINDNIELVKPIISPKGDLQRRRREDAAEVVAKPEDIVPVDELVMWKGLPIKKLIEAAAKIVVAVTDAVKKDDHLRRKREDAPAEVLPALDPAHTLSHEELLQLKFPSIKDLRKVIEAAAKIVNAVAEATKKGDHLRRRREDAPAEVLAALDPAHTFTNEELEMWKGFNFKKLIEAAAKIVVAVSNAVKKDDHLRMKREDVPAEVLAALDPAHTFTNEELEMWKGFNFKKLIEAAAKIVEAVSDAVRKDDHLRRKREDVPAEALPALDPAHTLSHEELLQLKFPSIKDLRKVIEAAAKIVNAVAEATKKGDHLRRRREDAPAEVVAKPEDIGSIDELVMWKGFPLKKVFEAAVKIVEAVVDATKKDDHLRRKREDAPAEIVATLEPAHTLSNEELAMWKIPFGKLVEAAVTIVGEIYKASKKN